MKKIILTSIILLAVNMLSLASPRMILEDKKENYVQNETGYVIHFKLQASSDEMSAMTAKVSELADRLTLSMSEGVNNLHDCVLTLNHQNQPEYVHKMLLSIGIGDLEYKGIVQSLDNIITILYSYL